MPSLAEWLIWSSLAGLDVWLYSLGLQPRWIGIITVLFFLTGVAVSEWGQRQLRRLTREHRLKKARDLAQQRGVADWLPLLDNIKAETRVSQESVMESMKLISSAMNPLVKDTTAAVAAGSCDVRRGQRMNRHAYNRCAKAVNKELRSLRKHVMRFEIGSANLCGWFDCLSDLSDARSISVASYRSEASRYVELSSTDVPLVRRVMETINASTRRKSQHLDAAVGDYSAIMERFAVAYEAIGESSKRLLGVPRSGSSTERHEVALDFGSCHFRRLSSGQVSIVMNEVVVTNLTEKRSVFEPLLLLCETADLRLGVHPTETLPDELTDLKRGFLTRQLFGRAIGIDGLSPVIGAFVFLVGGPVVGTTEADLARFIRTIPMYIEMNNKLTTTKRLFAEPMAAEKEKARATT